MKCPLCESRKAKRFCPAKAAQICPVCCGTKREVEIDCPSNCPYLQSGREYESQRLARTTPPPPQTRRLWDPQFLQQHQRVVFGMALVIVRTRKILPDLVDSDVHATLDALVRTFETLDKGIYYDSTPASLNQKNLFMALKLFLEGPEERLIDEPRLTTHQILDCLQFLKELSTLVALPRPKSRAFLDHLEGITRDSREKPSGESRLILPAGM